MSGKSVTALKFYSNTSQSWTGTFKVFLKEVENTTLSAFVGAESASVVFEGTGLAVDANKEMAVTFSNAYSYSGGNLLVGFYQTVKGNYKSMKFYGVGQSATTAWQGYSSSGIDAVTGSGKSFIPKTTFTYETPLSGPGFAVKDYADGATVAFGKVVANGTKDITLKNPGTEAVTVNITTTGGFTAASSITIGAKSEETLTITAPAETATGTITMTPTADDVAAITLNLSCVVLESAKMMADFTGDTWPAGWTYTNNGAGWKFYEGAVYYWNSSSYSSTPTNDIVTTKYKVSAGDVLMFDAYKNSAAYDNSYVSLKVYKSTDGETWGDPIASYTGANMETSFTGFTIENIPAGSYYFKFTANQVCLDNIYGLLPAIEPKDLAVTKSGTSATLTWTAATTETNWQVFASTDADAINSATPIDVASTATYTFTDLTVGATYYVWVRSKFGEDNYSDWVRTTFSLTYRAAAPTSVDGNGITNVTFGTGAGIVNNSTRPTSSPYYGDYSAQEGLVWPEMEMTVAITFGTNYEYGTVVWVDWNQNYEFEDSEIVFAGESAKAVGSVLNAVFTVPANQAIGKYRMRIAAADNYYDSHKTMATAAGADPYPTTTYCVVHDYTLNVTEAPSVLAPSDLAASNVTYNSVVLSWTAGSDETEWKVVYGAAGFDPASEGTTIDNVTENPYTLTGLIPETEYDVYVKAVKGSDISSVGNKANFTTAERYPAPTDLTISNLKATSATLTWTAGDATSWEVAINTTGETPATEAGTGIEVNAATYDFTGLTAETTYYTFVRVKDGTNYGKWSAACQFTPTAAVDLTIFGGTDTNSYLPVYGNSSASTTSYTQFIIPSSKLLLVKDGKIKKLTFYSAEQSKTLKAYSVYVKETTDEVFTSNDASQMSGTVVYNGVLTISDNKMEVAFDTPFEYAGGNLQVGFAQNTKETAVASSWYGESQSVHTGRYYTRGSGGWANFLPKTTINYLAYVSENPALRITDPNSQILAESPVTYEFGMTETAETAEFTLKNTGSGTLVVKSITATGGYQVKIDGSEAAETIGETTIGTIEDAPVTLQVIQPAGLSEGAITITTDVDGNEEDETFVINVSGMVRDANKEYQAGFTALPSGWTSEGNWSYSAANGAYTQAWYINSGTLARLKTPKLTVAAGETFIVEAKGYSTSYTEYQHLVLQYSTNGTDWTTFSGELELDPTDWKKFIVTWPNDVEAGEYYIALLASQADIRMYYGGEVIIGANFAINIAENAEQDFGRVQVNAVAEKTYTVTNSGNADLMVAFTEADNFKVLNATEGLTVAAGSSATFTVQMVTTTPGEKSGNIVLTFDALNATSFTIPCTGTVIDPNYLIVDFADGQFPQGWQVGADWTVTSGCAVQSNTRTASAIITTPLIVAEGETLKFKAARNASGQGNVTSLKTRYSTNGGATWSAYTNYNIEGTSLTEMTLTGVPAGTVILEFLGSNIKLDDIEGFTKTTANALYLTDENGVVIEDGDKKDFGNLTEEFFTIYTLKNIGNTEVNMMIIADDKDVYRPVNAIFVNPDQGVVVNGTANAKIPAGKSVGIKLTVPFQAPYGEREGTLKIYFDESNFPKFAFVDYSANLIDPTDFVEDFEKNTKPAGWYSEWNYANGVAYINSGSAKPMITELISVEEGKNELSFDAKVYYDYGTGTTQTLDVYTSADRKEWTLAKTVELTGDVNHVTLNDLKEGSYYVKFEAANAQVDNIEGVKRLEAPAHDLFVANTTLPTGSSFVDTEINVTATVTSLRVDETGVYAKLFVGDEEVATADAANIALDGSKTFSMAYTPNTVGEYEAYIKVYYSSEEVAFTTLTSTFEVVNYPSLVLDETSIEALSFATGTYDVTLNRSFAARWNTICLPFEVQVTDIHEDAVAYEFDSYNAELNELNFKSVTMLSAATPYVIYVPEAITTALEFKKQSMNSYYASASAVNSNGAKFQGTYTAIAAPGMEGKYGVTKDGKIAKGSDKASMKGFRAYFELPQVSQDVSGVRMSFLDETTGIKRVISSDMLDNHLYNLNGQPVQEVKKGLYIKNGKKVVIK